MGRVLKLRYITNDVLKLHMVRVCPAELRVLAKQTPQFVGSHSINLVTLFLGIEIL